MRTLILGIDAFDPIVFERLVGEGRLPHLARYVQSGGYARFGVSNPPQSEVSWTSIATGLNPGGHGIFDFVQRDPATYSLYVSLLPTRRGLGGTQFVPPFTARTIFDQAASKGFPATSMWWPATFPARLESPVRTLPGLGTPDIQGKLGVGTLFTTETSKPARVGKTSHEPLQPKAPNRFRGNLKGPKEQARGEMHESETEFQIECEGSGARLFVGAKSYLLTLGEWTPILEIGFKLGRFINFPTLTRAILTQVTPHLRIYFLPVQLHPLRSPWPYGSPGGFVKDIWQTDGPFLTLGWPQDTTGLEDACISDGQFLSLCESIDRARENILLRQVRSFREGLLGCVFDSLDRLQHMFWRDRPDVVEAWYEKLDALVGRVEAELQAARGGEPARMIVVSDHGFARFDYKVHLNGWLRDHGFLCAAGESRGGSLRDVDWSRTQAYAVGLNSIYLNLAGREGKGSVPESDKDGIERQIRDGLLEWRGPGESRVISEVWGRLEAFEGKLSGHAPDLVVGFAPGFRASQETGLGNWVGESLEENKDHWGADHCIDPREVPGTIFANSGLKDFPTPTYKDLPALAIGAAPDPGRATPSQPNSQEDQEIVQERLRSLGYL